MHLMHSCWPHATVRSWGRRRLQPRKEQHCLTQHKRSTGLGREQKQGAPVDGVDGDGGREAGEQHGLAALVGALGGGREDAAQAHVLHLLRSGQQGARAGGGSRQVQNSLLAGAPSSFKQPGQAGQPAPCKRGPHQSCHMPHAQDRAASTRVVLRPCRRAAHAWQRGALPTSGCTLVRRSRSLSTATTRSSGGVSCRAGTMEREDSSPPPPKCPGASYLQVRTLS